MPEETDESYRVVKHYGVKGMKWGVSRTPEELGRIRGGIENAIGNVTNRQRKGMLKSASALMKANERFVARNSDYLNGKQDRLMSAVDRIFGKEKMIARRTKNVKLAAEQNSRLDAGKPSDGDLMELDALTQNRRAGIAVGAFWIGVQAASIALNVVEQRNRQPYSPPEDLFDAEKFRQMTRNALDPIPLPEQTPFGHSNMGQRTTTLTPSMQLDVDALISTYGLVSFDLAKAESDELLNLAERET